MVGDTHVLVVDDAPDYLTFMAQLLHEEGFVIETVNSVEEARRIIAVGRPDLLITDLMIWRQPLSQLISMLDEDASMREIPVLVCTAAVEAVKDAAEIRRPSTAVLTKPFDIEQLLTAIDQLLPAHRSATA